jgi:hypothetical protein
MTSIGARLSRLERARPRPSPYDAMDPILAELSTPDLRVLVQHADAVREGRCPTAEQELVYGRLRARLAPVGIVLP